MSTTVENTLVNDDQSAFTLSRLFHSSCHHFDIRPVKNRLLYIDDCTSLQLLSNSISGAEPNLETNVSYKLEKYKSQWASEGILF